MVTMSQQSPEKLPHLNPNTIIESIIQEAMKSPQSTDKSSTQGKFGWTVFNNEHIPYILRQNVKYVSLVIMRSKFLDAFQNYFTIELYMFFEIDLQRMTEAEANLLNEINVIHSNRLFGGVNFKADDKLISLRDARHLSDFLYFSFEKLIRKRLVSSLRKTTPCGFMRINKQNCIPFVCYMGKLYVPLFYIDGDCKYLQERAVELIGWPLAYLKLCCKIHGVQKPIYKDNSMTVVDIDLVRKYYPENTAFEECWPRVSFAQSLVIQNTGQHPTDKPKEPKHAVKYLPYREKTVTNFANPSEFNERLDHAGKSTFSNRMEPIRQNIPENVNSNTARYDPTPYPGPKEPSRPQDSNCPSPDCSSVQRFQIPEYETDGRNCPYKIFTVPLGDVRMHFCVNMIPYKFDRTLVTVGELLHLLRVYPKVFIKAIDFLNIKVYLANAQQKQLLSSYGVESTVGLLEVDTVTQRIREIGDAYLRFFVPPQIR